jgi:hypothetical protein
MARSISTHHNLQSKLTAARHERKYLLPGLPRQQVINLIKQHPAFFTEIYQPRIVNNIYYDTQRFEHYYANLNGVAQRLKPRLRWYSQVFPHQGNDKQGGSGAYKPTPPHFELKVKQNQQVKKYLSSLKQIMTSAPSLITDLHVSKQSSLLNLPNDLKLSRDKQGSQEVRSDFDLNLVKASLHQPVLLNSYLRSYYLSADQKIRLTVDSKVEFHPITTGRINFSYSYQLPATILEVKAPVAHDDLVRTTTRYFPFRLSKSSKYMIGMDGCYGGSQQWALQVKLA